MDFGWSLKNRQNWILISMSWSTELRCMGAAALTLFSFSPWLQGKGLVLNHSNVDINAGRVWCNLGINITWLSLFLWGPLVLPLTNLAPNLHPLEYRDYFEKVELIFSLCNRWSGSHWHITILYPNSRQCLSWKGRFAKQNPTVSWKLLVFILYISWFPISFSPSKK